MMYEIKEVYRGFEAVFLGGVCVGVVVPSRSFPSQRMFFVYDCAKFYYGNNSGEAVAAYMAAKFSADQKEAE